MPPPWAASLKPVNGAACAVLEAPLPMIKTNLVSPLISSNAPGAAGADLRAIKQPVPIPNLWLWIGSAAGLVLLAALAWWAWRRYRRRTPKTKLVPVIPPHEKAKASLQAALSLLDQPRPFCILVSDTVRTYLEERFTLRAPERTTEEFLEELQSSPVLTDDQKQTLGEFLSGCDLVKFARYEPAQSELQAIYDTAVRLVDETQPPPVLSETTPDADALSRAS